MKYRDIELVLPSGYPVLAHIRIDPADWFRFERMTGDTPIARIIGRDDSV
jgi:hypothetical protein